MNYFGKNIRLLRKKLGYSQEELAKLLSVNRSNIASYESKNVEPRLQLLVRIAEVLNVDLIDLIEKDLSDPTVTYTHFNKCENNAKELDFSVIKDNSQPVLGEFMEKSIRINKILEGFKSFYRYRLDQSEEFEFPDKKLLLDIENFINLAEYLLKYNKEVINTIMSAKTA